VRATATAPQPRQPILVAVPAHLRIGTAGWSIPRAMGTTFAADGTHLQRYASRLTCAEINSSFHRPHAARTYEKWAASTPLQFRFAVKLPRTITHDQRLRRAREPLERFLDESSGLGERRGPLLVQLPPSLEFDARLAGTFMTLLRSRHAGPVVWEPRHPTWFTDAANSLFVRHEIARVAADPPPASGADRPGGWPGLVYHRLHGSPRRYWSPYEPAYLQALADALAVAPVGLDTWCIFDNTATGAALENAWELQRLTGASS
jgi:uncharacterized protein YecE (DUF72 family)